MTKLARAALGVVVLLVSAGVASAQVQLTLRNGRVTLSANNVTVRQILLEWQRVGQTKIVNVDRIPGAPVTLQFNDLPEDQALDILLRSVSGYMAAPRETPAANLSRYDRIFVLPTAVAARPAVAAVQAAPQGIPQQAPVPDDDEDRPAPSVVVPARGPIFQTFPQPQGGTPQPFPVPQQPVSGQPPAVVTPGVAPQPAPQPQMPPQFGQPANPNQQPSPTPGGVVSPTGGTSTPGVIVQPSTPQPGQVVQPARPSPDD